jgi:tetratricopeptide (TPR) repeat protein
LTRLLERIPGLHILSTSRHVLGIPGEVRLSLGPLEQDDARRLFLDRVRAARPDFVEEESSPTVAAICDRLEGVALALELAAAWSATLTLEDIRDRLSLPLLTQPRLATGSRYRSLTDCIAASYDLLPVSLRADWLRLAVFNGGWTLPAAAAVLGYEEDHALSVLAALQERSLITRETRQTPQTHTRFGMLETLREFARRRALTTETNDAAGDTTGGTTAEAALTAAEWDEASRRHLHWCIAELAVIDADIRRDTTAAAAYARFEEEDPNFRSAIDFGLSGTLEDYENALLLLRRAAPWWWQRGQERDAHIAQLIGWTKRAVERLDECSGDLRGSALRIAAFVDWAEGKMESALQRYQEAAGLHAASGNRIGQSVALQRMAQVYAATERLDIAAPLSWQAAEILASLGKQEAQHDVLAELAEMYLWAGQPQSAMPLLERCRRYARSRPSGEGIAMRGRIASLLAGTERQNGNLLAAEQYAREAIPLWEGRGDRWRLAEARHLLGMVLYEQKRFAEAADLLQKVLAFFIPHVQAEKRYGDKPGAGFRDVSVAMVDEAHSALTAMGIPQEIPSRHDVDSSA